MVRNPVSLFSFLLASVAQILPVTGILQAIYYWSKYSWCLWCIKNWLLNSVASCSSQKLNLQRFNIFDTSFIVTPQKLSHRWWFLSKLWHKWNCLICQIASKFYGWKMLWKLSFSARVVCRTLFLIVPIKNMPRWTDFRELGVTLYCLRKGLSFGWSRLSQEFFQEKKPCTYQEGLTLFSRRNSE